MNGSRRNAPAAAAPARRLFSKTLRFVPAAVGLAVPFIFHFEGLSPAGHHALAIFLVAASLWILEPVPLYATAVLIFLLEILFLSDKGFFRIEGAIPYRTLLHPLSSPLIVLFLGGFALADASRKFGLDRELAQLMLKPFGSRPRVILLGVMLITAAFSAFMSNTACTAMMMAVVFPAMASLDADDKLRVALALAVPFAANIGGMATPIGTPPNAVALGGLAKLGIELTFFDWVKLALPFTLVMLAVVWAVLALFFPPKADSVRLSFGSGGERGPARKLVYIVFAATVLLWITGKWHGIPDGVVALLPVAVFAMAKVLSPREFNSLSWDILWLIAGGLALGAGMQKTGLTHWMLSLVPFSDLPWWGVVGAFCAGTLALSTFMSNTATSNLFVPLAVGLASSASGGGLELLVALGLASSLAMSLPISTPPNAIAYSTGLISTRDMAKGGIVIGVTGLLLLVFANRFLWHALGLV